MLDVEDDTAQNALRTLSVSLSQLGQILCYQRIASCLEHLKESVFIAQRIKDNAIMAVGEINIGQAYLNIPAIRDLDAAEVAYQRSSRLVASNDTLARAKCLMQTGLVYHFRFRDALQRQLRSEMSRHAEPAKTLYLDAIQLLPKDAFENLALLHGQLGIFLADIGHFDDARRQFEQVVDYHERVNNYIDAGKGRYNLAFLYRQRAAKTRDASPKQTNDMLSRASAYASAALKNFQRYEGRAAKDETRAKDLIEEIDQERKRLPKL